MVLSPAACVGIVAASKAHARTGRETSIYGGRDLLGVPVDEALIHAQVQCAGELKIRRLNLFADGVYPVMVLSMMRMLPTCF